MGFIGVITLINGLIYGQPGVVTPLFMVENKWALLR